MKTETHIYRDGDTELEGFVAWDETQTGPRPVVLVSHAWAGLGDFERDKARALAELGFVGFAIDNYGKGRRGSTTEENQALMMPWMEDRTQLRRRLQAAVNAARELPQAEASHVAAIGFCFGGLCVLDMARAGMDLACVVSFHGLLVPAGLPPEHIGARVLVLHGHDDPMVSKDDFDAFTAEMTANAADWQIHQYGHTLHAFTNPAANDRSFGTVYEPKADRRSWQSLTAFLAEAFGAGASN